MEKAWEYSAVGGMLVYRNGGKRILDVCVSLVALVVLSPVLMVLTICGACVTKGNPFFVQERPGKKDKSGEEKIFKLIKFRTMTCEKGEDGQFLPDNKRLTRYGRLLRSTSLDELPELMNILKGDMSLVGPRPLSVKYLPYYTEDERHRHDVRPGLTGLAQVNGRNSISWEKKFYYDLLYVDNISFLGDIKIVLDTAKKVFIREGIGQAEEAPVSLHILRQESKANISKEKKKDDYSV